LAVPAPMQAKLSEPHTLSRRAVLEYFASWQEDIVSNCGHFVLQFRSTFYLLFTPTRLGQN